MKFKSLIIGVILATIIEIRVNGSVLPLSKLREISNGTINAVNAQADKKFLEWILQVLGQNPSSTTPYPELVKPENCPPCKCGLTNTQRRIVGGVETKRNEYPWMAQMMQKGKFYCGASVINSQYVITAGHCVDGFDKANIIVRIGYHDRSSITEFKTRDFKVARIIKHGGYSTLDYDNDVAAVKIQGVIKFDGSMRPVCLAEKGPTYAGKMGIVTGWGAVEEAGPTSNTLLEVSIPIMTNSDCKLTKYPARRITDNMMCAGYIEGGKDSCQGDSGGPLHVVNEEDKIHRLVGIVSWGEGCALPNYPGVYTRVNRYLTWIKVNTADACYCD